MEGREEEKQTGEKKEGKKGLGLQSQSKRKGVGPQWWKGAGSVCGALRLWCALEDFKGGSHGPMTAL